MATTLVGATRKDMFAFPPESIGSIHLGTNLRYNLGDLTDLAKSIARDGQIQPVVVRRDSQKNPVLVLGFRRFAAIQLINEDPAKYGLTGRQMSLLARFESVTEEEALRLNVQENTQRTDLSPMDLAVAARELGRRGMGRSEVAELMNRTTANISQLLGLFDLPQEVIDKVHTGEIGMSAATALRGLDTQTITEVVESGDTTTEIATAARAAKRSSGQKQGRSLKEVRQFLEGLCDAENNQTAILFLKWIEGDPEVTDIDLGSLLTQ